MTATYLPVAGGMLSFRRRRRFCGEPRPSRRHRSATITPGMPIGPEIRWFTIGPVNVVFGALFRGFNRVFDRRLTFTVG